MYSEEIRVRSPPPLFTPSLIRRCTVPTPPPPPSPPLKGHAGSQTLCGTPSSLAVAGPMYSDPLFCSLLPCDPMIFADCGSSRIHRCCLLRWQGFSIVLSMICLCLLPLQDFLIGSDFVGRDRGAAGPEADGAGSREEPLGKPGPHWKARRSLCWRQHSCL